MSYKISEIDLWLEHQCYKGDILLTFLQQKKFSTMNIIYTDKYFFTVTKAISLLKEIENEQANPG